MDSEKNEKPEKDFDDKGQNNEDKECSHIVVEDKPLNRLRRPHLRDSLLKVLQKMLPTDYVSFMLTNKVMFEVCKSAKKMPQTLQIGRVEGCEDDGEDHEEFLISYPAILTFPGIGDEQLKALRSLPHPIAVDEFKWKHGLLRVEDIQAIETLMEENKVKKIEKVTVDDYGYVTCWNEFIEMTKTFKTEILEINCDESVETLSRANMAALFQSKRWVEGFTIDTWTFGFSLCDTFLALMFGKQLDFSMLRYEFSYPLPPERPLVFRHSDASTYWILREDGKILRISSMNMELVLHQVQKSETTRFQPPTALRQ